MKKSLFLTVMLVSVGLFASSCSQQRVVDTPQASNGTIAFRPILDYSKTRGTEVTTATLTTLGAKFNVWAQDHGKTDWRMTNVEVEYDGAAFFKSLSANYYWPESGDVKFWGIHNNYSGTTTVDNIKKGITNFEPAKAHSGASAMSDLQKDLVMAYGTGNKAANQTSGMKLKFQHALSQVSFMAKNSSPSYDVYIAGVSIHHLDGKADVTFQTSEDQKPSWSNNTQALTEKVIYHNLGSFPANALGADAVSVTSGTAKGSNFMVVPQQITEYSGTQLNGAFARVYIRVVDKSSGDVIYPSGSTGRYDVGAADIPLPAVNWEAGKHYVYTLDFTKGIGDKPYTPIEEDPNPNVNPEPVVPTPKPSPTPTPTPILGEPIKFTVEVVQFVSSPQPNIEM